MRFTFLLIPHHTLISPSRHLYQSTYTLLVSPHQTHISSDPNKTHSFLLYSMETPQQISNSQTRSRLDQKQAPPSPISTTTTPHRASSSSSWKAVIPLLSPLILSPTSPTSSSLFDNDGDDDRVLVVMKPNLIVWQHPASPFSYVSVPSLAPFAPHCAQWSL